jgi:hypothetical protein
MHHGTVCVDLVLLFYNGLDGTRATVSGHAHWTPEGGRTHAILELFQPGPKKELDPSAARERKQSIRLMARPSGFPTNSRATKKPAGCLGQREGLDSTLAHIALHLH